ncbi:MAG: hypothetical protein V3U35_08150 [Candidatus Neomarinimicrobiota bacterium]
MLADISPLAVNLMQSGSDPHESRVEQVSMKVRELEAELSSDSQLAGRELSVDSQLPEAG